MPFTQDATPTNKSVCNGCDEHCKLGGYRYLAFVNNGYCNYLSPYYWPTIGGKIIPSYTAADGTTVSTEQRAKTQADATQLAYIIAKLCANYKTKQDNQR